MATQFGISPARTLYGETLDLLFLMCRMAALEWEDKVKDPVLAIPFPNILDTFKMHRKGHLAPVLHETSPADPM